MHRDGFQLNPGSITDMKRGNDLSRFTGSYTVGVTLDAGASARRFDRFESDRSGADVLIFKMSDRVLVAKSRVQIDNKWLGPCPA